MTDNNYPPLPDLDDTLWVAIGQHRRAITATETEAAAEAVDNAVEALLRAYIDADRAQRKPLTDEEINRLWLIAENQETQWDFARAIEAAHGIKAS